MIKEVLDCLGRLSRTTSQDRMWESSTWTQVVPSADKRTAQRYQIQLEWQSAGKRHTPQSHGSYYAKAIKICGVYLNFTP